MLPFLPTKTALLLWLCLSGCATILPAEEIRYPVIDPGADWAKPDFNDSAWTPAKDFAQVGANWGVAEPR